MKTAVVQNKVWQEEGYEDFIAELEKVFAVKKVNVIPFTEEIHPEVAEPDLVLGSTRLIDLARKRGWHVFPDFQPVEFEIFNREYWLNGIGGPTKIKDFVSFRSGEGNPVFVKPFTPKLFTAGICGEDFLNEFQFTKTESELAEEVIWVSQLKNISGPEYRFFIINGKIITGSSYKEKRRSEITPHGSTWKALDKMIKSSRLASGITGVVDLVWSDGWKIVEMNNLNSAGVYNSNYKALAEALAKNV